MKKSFIRILSPITIIISLLLDASSVWITAFAVKKLIEGVDGIKIAFAAMVLFAIIISALFTKQAFSNGIVIYNDRCEFNAIDNDNVIFFNDIESVEGYKDTKASLKKNFNERHSLIIFNLKNDNIHTVDIGLTTNRALKKIVKLLKENIE